MHRPRDRWRVSRVALVAAALGLVLVWQRQGRKAADRFAGKVVVITGGSRGLGLELARAFGQDGAKLAICARTEDDLRRAERELVGRGHEVLALVCDVTDAAQCAAFVERVLGHWGRIDALVNNAGVIQAGPLAAMTTQDFEQAMATHFWGPLRLIQACLPGMRTRGEGQIVNIASIGGEVSVPHLTPYCASKFALVGLSGGLTTELRREGIFVTTVCPGLMRTGSPRNAQFKGDHRAEYACFSIADSLPALAISSESAARQIVAAASMRQSYLRCSLVARSAAPLRGFFPGLTTRFLALVNSFLPGRGGVNSKQAEQGYESFSAWSPSMLTTLTEQAAARNNELGTKNG